MTVSHTGLHQGYIDAELGLELGNHNIQVLLAQAGNDLLLSLHIILKADAGIFLDQALHSTGDLGLIALALQHNGHGEAGSRELGGLIGDDTLGVTQGIKNTQEQVEKAEKINEIASDISKCEEELWNIDEKILQLIHLVDGVKTNDTGLVIKSGKPEAVTDGFAKMAVNGEVSMISVGVGDSRIYDP